MMEKLFAKSGPEWTTLEDHLNHVALASKKFATVIGMDPSIAFNGAILHDIGKAHPVFQKRLKQKDSSKKVFRHEIASLLFLSVFPKEQHHALIEMVAGHHKSVIRDPGDKGLLDLEEGYDYESFHLGEWDLWSKKALKGLAKFGFECSLLSENEALSNLAFAVQYCQQCVNQRGFSRWRGLLMGADHFASAVINDTEKHLNKAFQKPDLSFYNRQHPLYPLSLKDASSEKNHTMVVACTGAGKTDYLFKRCQGRVFYTLPFQASINAMFKRVDKDLKNTNPELDIRVLHAASSVVRRKKEEEESVLQSLFGSSIKVLTPHQLAAIAFGMKGYEALLLDLQHCDIILDEIHTYTGASQAIVLKLVEILKSIGCKIHIGTATMPTDLYNKILTILGDDVLEVELKPEEMDQFNRHTVHKLSSFNEGFQVIKDAVNQQQKVLVVLNQVATAQQVYHDLKIRHPNTPVLLLHSRFKRGDRNEKEKKLLGLNEYGEPAFEFNTSLEACIVVSTQIVEVSLDISFDLMITEAAPLDALIQRFGRVNRKRSEATIGKTKPVYVIAPPEDKKKAKPYDLEVLTRSFEVLPENKVLEERTLQTKIDQVFPSIDFMNIEEHAVFKADGSIRIDKLTHHSKSILFELLDIDSVSCIQEKDQQEYESAFFERRLELEIPVRYFSVHKMPQSQKGNKPFIIPDIAYDDELGLDTSKIKEENFDTKNQLL